MNVTETVSHLTFEASKAISFAASNGYLFAKGMKDENSFLYNLRMCSVWAFAGRANADQRQAVILADAMCRPAKVPWEPTSEAEFALNSIDPDHSKLKELFMALTEFDEGKFDDDLGDLIILKTVRNHDDIPF